MPYMFTVGEETLKVSKGTIKEQWNWCWALLRDRDDIELSRLYARGSSALDCADLEIRGVAATTLSSDWLHDRSSPQSARQVEVLFLEQKMEQ